MVYLLLLYYYYYVIVAILLLIVIIIIISSYLPGILVKDFKKKLKTIKILAHCKLQKTPSQYSGTNI